MGGKIEIEIINMRSTSHHPSRLRFGFVIRCHYLSFTLPEPTVFLLLLCLIHLLLLSLPLRLPVYLSAAAQSRSTCANLVPERKPQPRGASRAEKRLDVKSRTADANIKSTAAGKWLRSSNVILEFVVRLYKITFERISVRKKEEGGGDSSPSVPSTRIYTVSWIKWFADFALH